MAKPVDKQKLWEAYAKNPTQELREQIIVEYAPLVKVVAGRLCMYLGNNVEYDELVSCGIFGLIDAIDKFDLNVGMVFGRVSMNRYFNTVSAKLLAKLFLKFIAEISHTV